MQTVVADAEVADRKARVGDGLLGQSLFHGSKAEQQQGAGGGECSGRPRVPNTHGMQSGGRGQMRLEDRTGRQRTAAGVDKIPRLPAGRELALKRMKALEVIRPVQACVEEAAHGRSRGGVGGVIVAGQRGQPQAEKLCAFRREVGARRAKPRPDGA